MAQDNTLENLTKKIKNHLEFIYTKDIADILSKIIDLIESYGTIKSRHKERWTEKDIIAISYGNSIISKKLKPLETLNYFAERYLKNKINILHILPFFPYSSDDGFAIIDYKNVNPELGFWDDINNLAENFDLMFDLVINHVSSRHTWFQNFLQGKDPGKDYFIDLDPDVDLSNVTRPRSGPLLQPVETVNGLRYVWATFSRDQIDLNFSNPKVLLEFIDILLFYLHKNARLIRLDAVGFLWKILGTSCMHLQETHRIIRLLRDIAEYIRPDVIFVSETNVPFKENLSYFGESNEAHMIYNFTLPPLVVYTLVSGNSGYINEWAKNMPAAPEGCAYFNFTASHDGIGLRPIEGILSNKERDKLLALMRKDGGEISSRDIGHGKEAPYEINITIFDALRRTFAEEDNYRIERFLCSQFIKLSMFGIPAFYIHNLLATVNDYAYYKVTGQKRSLNRHQWKISEIEYLLSIPSTHYKVFNSLIELIRIRKKFKAFHPYAGQKILNLNNSFYGLLRISLDGQQVIAAICNVTGKYKNIDLKKIGFSATGLFDLVSNNKLDVASGQLHFAPYQFMWLINK